MADMTVVGNGLVRVFDDNQGERWVSARELHEFLESGYDFSNWIQDRISRYGFEEGVEFSRENLKTQSSAGGRPRTEYWLTLDCAKEIAMVENNEKGRLVRRYFLAIEKKFKQAVGMGAISPISVEEFLVQQAQAMLAQRRALEQMQARVDGALEEVKEARETTKVLQHRIDSLDQVDTEGTPRQRLNGMIRKYARQEGIYYDAAWREFEQRFNTAFRMNLKTRRQNYAVAKGLRRIPSLPEYLEAVGLIEDAIRVADKMLNPRSDGE